MFPYALWEDQTTTKVVTGTTTFQSIYGQEVVIPLELQLATFRLAFHTKKFQEFDLINRFHTLLILDEQRTKALIKSRKGKTMLKSILIKKVKSATFEVGK